MYLQRLFSIKRKRGCRPCQEDAAEQQSDCYFLLICHPPLWYWQPRHNKHGSLLCNYCVCVRYVTHPPRYLQYVLNQSSIRGHINTPSSSWTPDASFILFYLWHKQQECLCTLSQSQTEHVLYLCHLQFTLSNPGTWGEWCHQKLHASKRWLAQRDRGTRATGTGGVEQSPSAANPHTHTHSYTHHHDQYMVLINHNRAISPASLAALYSNLSPAREIKIK